VNLTRVAVVPLRALLGLLFVFLVAFETLSLPGMFWHWAREDADFEPLKWPIAVVLCVQVVIVCTWRLLTMVTTDRIFSDDAFRWVDTIVGAIVAAETAMAGLLVYLYFTWDDPGLGVLLMLGLLGGAVLGLLMLVMRALLRQATTLRTDMEAVI
jgi:hypothetical protein